MTRNLLFFVCFSLASVLLPFGNNVFADGEDPNCPKHCTKTSTLQISFDGVAYPINTTNLIIVYQPWLNYADGDQQTNGTCTEEQQQGNCLPCRFKGQIMVRNNGSSTRQFGAYWPQGSGIDEMTLEPGQFGFLDIPEFTIACQGTPTTVKIWLVEGLFSEPTAPRGHFSFTCNACA